MKKKKPHLKKNMSFFQESQDLLLYFAFEKDCEKQQRYLASGQNNLKLFFISLAQNVHIRTLPANKVSVPFLRL